MGIIYQGLTSHPCTHKVTNSLAVTGFGLSFIVTSLTTEEKVPQKLELEKKIEFSCAIMSQRIKGTAMRLKRR